MQPQQIIVVFSLLLVALIVAQQDNVERVHYKVAEVMDKKVNPCDDFYQYSCGGFIKNIKINKNVYPYAANVATLMQDHDDHLLIHLMESKKVSPVLHTFYSSCINRDNNDAISKAHFPKIIKRLENMLHKHGIWHTVGVLQTLNIVSFFKYSVTVDSTNSKKFNFVLEQPKFPPISTRKRAQIAELFHESGAEPTLAKAQKSADAVIRLVNALSEMYSTEAYQIRIDTQDPEDFPGIDWDTYFRAALLSKRKLPVRLFLANQKYFERLESFTERLSVADVEPFFKWLLLVAFKSALPKRLNDKLVNLFYEGTFYPTQLLRKRVCFHQTQKWLGFLLSKHYVERGFGMESKSIAKDMISRINAAYIDMFKHSKWLDEKTKQGAILKLKSMRAAIAGPKTWPNYNTLKLDDKNFVVNLYQARKFEYLRVIARLDGPVPAGQLFEDLPTTINAYNAVTPNEFVMPAGIMHPPIFDPNYSDPVNYGRLGVIIGHEISHGYDVNGQLYDEKGELRKWFSPSTAQLYKEKAKCYVNQFNQFRSRQYKVNGRITLDENIADAVGIRVTYEALAKKMTPNVFNSASAAVPSLTNEQLFFVAFAQRWCQKDTPDYSALYKDDPHAPSRARVNGSVQNMPEFARAFKCPANAKMNPKNRCSLFV